MEKLDYQLLFNIYRLLNSMPVNFFLLHSLGVGLLTGTISLIPFWLKQLPHFAVAVIILLSFYYLSNRLNLDFGQLFYSKQANFIADFLGNYVVGYIYGCAIANIIQRIRGEHHYASY